MLYSHENRNNKQNISDGSTISDGQCWQWLPTVDGQGSLLKGDIELWWNDKRDNAGAGWLIAFSMGTWRLEGTEMKAGLVYFREGKKADGSWITACGGMKFQKQVEAKLLDTVGMGRVRHSSQIWWKGNDCLKQWFMLKVLNSLNHSDFSVEKRDMKTWSERLVKMM